MVVWNEVLAAWGLDKVSSKKCHVQSLLEKNPVLAERHDISIAVAFGLLFLTEDKLDQIQEFVEACVESSWLPVTVVGFGCDAVVFASEALPDKVIKVGRISLERTVSFRSFYELCMQGGNCFLPEVFDFKINEEQGLHFCIQERVSSFERLPWIDRPSNCNAATFTYLADLARSTRKPKPDWYNSVFGGWGCDWRDRYADFLELEPIMVAHSLESESLYRQAAALMSWIDDQVQRYGCHADCTAQNVGFSPRSSLIVFDPIH